MPRVAHRLVPMQKKEQAEAWAREAQIVETGGPQSLPVPDEVQIGIHVTVPWETLEMQEAQQWYATLKAEFEHAGAVLNARLCAQKLDSFTCFMAGSEGACKAGIVHKGRPAGTDYAHKNPKTGLLQPAMICSERCWILYQAELIRERREKELLRAQQ